MGLVGKGSDARIVNQIERLDTMMRDALDTLVSGTMKLP